jgi:multiple PDZ domain protein/inactivation no afterpotential D protein
MQAECTNRALCFQIYRASAGNVKRSKEEIEADQEEEDEFGYTTSE